LLDASFLNVFSNLLADDSAEEEEKPRKRGSPFPFGISNPQFHKKNNAWILKKGKKQVLSVS